MNFEQFLQAIIMKSRVDSQNNPIFSLVGIFYKICEAWRQA